MDARNAAESSSTKQIASPKEGDSGRGSLQTTSISNTAADTQKSPTRHKPAPGAPDSSAAITVTKTRDEDAALDQNSDAETIVLPGKDGVSPSKPRKVIKHEDKSDEEMNDIPQPKKPSSDTRDSDRNGAHFNGPASLSLTSKKKRSSEKERELESLALAPASPLNDRTNNKDGSLRRHRSGDVQSESGSESSRDRSHETYRKDQVKSMEGLLPTKRKTVKIESDDDGELRKARRPRASDISIDTSVSVRERDQRTSGRQLEKQFAQPNKSTSPPSRAHRRSLSTHASSQSANGLSFKKRRIPAPLQSTDYHSDDSSASGSPHPRSSKLRSVATPITGESTISPARMPGHKKHVDNHGQTLFAKACAKGEYEVAKKRLAERPEDLNFADYAGNTPLQVASLNGHEDIVKLLIEAGCNLDCRNSDKETPLLDAVENGHLGVVKLLLKAGVNPRKADAEGHEPLEKVPDDLENAEEIRAALREAKERVGELRRTSEDHQLPDVLDTLSSHGPDSPRGSPAAPAGGALTEKRRGGTVRSTKTSNHLLYMNLDDKTLRQAAARGDNETVTRVLQVKERCDDPEALVNAARGGHNIVVELLLALGGADPDPRPVPGLPTEYGTPMLAAIGQENIEVIKLLLNANGFNPTRMYKGQAYYEIARRREGPNWKEEEHILKEAFDQYKKSSKGGSKTKPSPNRRERDQDMDSRRGTRADTSPERTRSQKRRPSPSPSRDADSKRRANVAAKGTKSPTTKPRSSSFGTHDEQTSPKRGPGRPKRDERGSHIALSDREPSPNKSKNPAMPKLPEAEVAGSSDGEAIKPRRKLISGKDLKGQREKQRRESMASNATGADRSEPKNDESENLRADREKHLSRTKALKREVSTDRLSATDLSGKRHRLSTSPSTRGLGEKDESGGPMKRRKLDPEGRDKRHWTTVSPETHFSKRELSRGPSKRQQNPDTDRRDVPKPLKSSHDRRDSDKHSDRSITVASDGPDTEMPDAAQASEEEGEIAPEFELEVSNNQPKAVASESAAVIESRKRESERKREAERERRDFERQERERRELEEETRRKEQESEKSRLEAEERSRLEREDLKRKEDADKARREEEQKQKEEEERRRRDEQLRLQREEEEEDRKREEEFRKQREEAERKRIEEEERIRREKEAAEEARRIREEEEQQELERQRAEQAALEAERRAEEERIRVSKLPPVLRWLNSCPDPKREEFAELFTQAEGVRFDTIDPSATGKPGGHDQWLLNTQVALLLGEKDLSLSRYASWERVPVSRIAKRVIWRLEQDRYALTQSKLYHLGEQLAGFYGGDPRTVGYRRLEQIRGEAADLFFDTNLFFVKETDFLNIVPTVPHLRNVKLAIGYRELPEDESDLSSFGGTSKWKNDTDASAYGPFGPRTKYYVNGQLVGEDRPGRSSVRSDPFPSQKVPRRHGLVPVASDEPDFVRLCIEQNLVHLLTEQQKQSMLNGSHLTPKSMASNDATDYAGEELSPTSVSPRNHVVNGIQNMNLGSPEDRLPNGDSYHAVLAGRTLQE
ncbi:hypothetical protein F5Y17DRAFT_44559 [Xylariaceae sp. FL0594]|nr:hypothetical protein F5Y17DRAFT_44559 [Xylariaceae sp. FL0594]